MDHLQILFLVPYLIIQLLNSQCQYQTNLRQMCYLSFQVNLVKQNFDHSFGLESYLIHPQIQVHFLKKQLINFLLKEFIQSVLHFGGNFNSQKTQNFMKLLKEYFACAYLRFAAFVLQHFEEQMIVGLQAHVIYGILGCYIYMYQDSSCCCYCYCSYVNNI